MGGRGNFSGGTTRTTAHTISQTGVPNSRVIQYINGKKHMERRYDADGLPDEDIDYTDHGNPKKHPKVPNTHPWVWKNGEKKRGKEI